MHCAACGHANPERAKFCSECGTPFAVRCPSCAAELSAAAKFCGECGAKLAGAPLTPPSSTTDARKVVTIVFADLVGSTALHERLEPESARRFMESYYAAMRGAVEAHGGTVTQLLGDGVKAVFGIPSVAEDDAIRAVHAAVAMQEAFRALAEAQRGAVGASGLRVAVNTGEVVANDETEIIGDPVNVAARLQEQGKDGDVVVGESTHRLVSTLVTLELLGSFALKGRSEAVKAYRVVSLDRPAGVAMAPFVGRAEELTRLSAVYDRAVEKPAAGLAVLVGSPGLGKSRLIDEFALRSGEAATVIRAHCDAAGGATFAPLADALRELLGIEASADADALRAAAESVLPEGDADRARIAGGVASLLAGSPASPEETFFVVRRLLGAIAKQKPVVLVIDDLHWAEPLLLDLVEHLIQWGSGVPLFVLIGARPELRELRSSLVTPGGLISDVVTLSGLDAGAAMQLAANVIGAADLPAAIAAKVLATSEGNPLFVGELVRMLVEEGALTREGDRWVVGANLAELEMPPTIHALLAARIERLRPEERVVLERAAVVGRHFSRSAIAALLPGSAGDLDARVEALRRSELIERDTGWLLGEPVLRFHHVLIRDAAYRRLLKGTRAELHAKLADWIEAQVGDAAEHDETIGRHLERAHQFLRELGPIDEAGRRLGERAARRLAAAGRRALGRDDLPVASDLLGRAIDRLDTEDPARADLALDWCEALLASGDVGPAAAAIDELGRFTAGSERLRAWHTCFAGQHTVLTAPSALHETVGAVATAADELTALGDAAGEAKAHFVHALALSRLGKVGACEAALDRALAAARRAGDRRRANTVLAIAPLAALWGPSPVTRASGRCLDVVRVLRITQGAPAVEAVALSCQGVLEALRGRTEAARRMIASARQMVEELGITQRLLEADVSAGLVALLEGDALAAERCLRGAYGGLRDLGLGIDAARAAALLARTLLAQGRVEEAEVLSHESESLAGDDLKAAIAWRGVRAEALAKRGEHATAVEFASKAVELAAATDALLDHADARLALAAALRAAGRGREAAAEEGRAKELWQAKGATLLAERIAHAAAPVAPSVAASAPRAAHAPRRRPLRPNFAFEETRRAEAAVAARDARAIEALYRRDVVIVDHQFGITYGYAAVVERVRAVIEESTDGAFAYEPLATLGDSLALCRMRSTASGSTVHGIAIGATDVPYLFVFDADEQGSARHVEIFGDDKLADAIARLYERHAELLPEGAERERAAATARAIGTMLSAPADADRSATIFTADFESVDHRHLSTWSLRGGAAFVEHIRALHAVAADVAIGVEDVLALEPGALLVRRMHAGTERVGGGAYERPFLLLLVTGADGRIARAEWFDDDREAEALARFDALTSGRPTLPRPVIPPFDVVQGRPGPLLGKEGEPRRRVHPNSASAAGSRLTETFAARDAAAAGAMLGDRLEAIDHRWHATYGRDGVLETWRRMIRPQGADFRSELIATLGDWLSLSRSVHTASGATGGRFDVGEHATEFFVLAEVDGSGQFQRLEFFAAEHLADAVFRLYERYAELLPEGPDRTRAAGAARANAEMVHGLLDRDRLGNPFAPDVECMDHRVVGFGTLRGDTAVLDAVGAFVDLVTDARWRIDDVLALSPRQILSRNTNLGTDRAGGGAFERVILSFVEFGADGRVARWEIFEPTDEEAALARFDARAAAHDAQRRVRTNAATRSTARFVAALETRDADALPVLFDDALRVVHHPSGSTYGRREMLATWRSALRAERLEFRGQPIASLGDTLVLSREVTAVEGLREAHLADFGSTEVDEISLVETAADGRWLHVEIFAPDRLGEATVRMYERFALQQSEGSARGRLEAVARAVATISGPVDLERMLAAYAPNLRLTDHRVLATWSCESGAELVDHFRHHLELAPDFAARIDEVLALAPTLLVLRITYLGTARDSGGAFENRICVLYRFGDDGRFQQIECYEAEDAAAALACFDALTGSAAAAEPASHPFDNAASRADREFVRRFNARDWPGIEALAAPQLVFDERRRMLHNRCDREVWLEQLRVMFDVPASRFTTQLVATRGERLALSLHSFAGEVAGGGGPLAMDDHLVLHEIDRDGRIVAIVLFDVEAEDAARTELDARWLAGECAEHGRGKGSVGLMGLFAARDWEAVAAQFAPSWRARDHRTLGFGETLRDAATFVGSIQALAELAPDARYRIDHLRQAGGVELVQILLTGTREGGRFETPFLALGTVDEHGRGTSLDVYPLERLDEVRARFAALCAATRPSDPWTNTAAREFDSMVRRFNERDWAGIETAVARWPAFVFDDRRRMMRVALGREDFLAQYRFLFDVPNSRFESTLVATRGDRLSLHRILFSGEVQDGGGPLAFEEHLGLLEFDRDGNAIADVSFDLEDMDAAYAELDARYEAGEAAAFPHVLRSLETTHLIETRDWQGWLAGQAPDFRFRDHRRLGFGDTIRDTGVLLELFQATVALAPDAHYRDDHVRIGSRGILRQRMLAGTRDGGAFESPMLLVFEVDEQGKTARADCYDIDDRDRALARFAELEGLQGRFENGASRAWREVNEAWTARELDRFAAPHAAALRYRDHRRLFQLDLDRAGFLDFTRPLLTMRAGDASLDLVATRGERLALMHSVMRMEDETVGPSTIESLMMIETDECGDIAAYDRWDLEDADAAYAELDARYEAGEGATHAALSRWLRDLEATQMHPDAETIAALFAPSFLAQDHRLVGWGSLAGGDAFLESLRVLSEMAPDYRLRTDHVRTVSHGVVAEGAWIGTHQGGAFESPLIFVVELDADRRAVRLDLYDPRHVDRALTRFAEIDAPAASKADPFANAATRAFGRGSAALAARDWSGFAALFAPDFRNFDRRGLVQLESDREAWLASYRQIAEMTTATPTRAVLATRGERLALVRLLWQGAPGDVGPSELDWLMVLEVDERGDHCALVNFAPGDLDAADGELDARYEAGEGGIHGARIRSYVEAIASRDWEAVAGLCAPGFEEHDRRPIGVLDVARGGEAWAQSDRALLELAPDTIVRWQHHRFGPGCALSQVLFQGTREGARYEIPFVIVSELDAGHRSLRNDLYDPEQIEQAMARFAELCARDAAPRDPLAALAKPNAANAAMDRWQAAYDGAYATDDWAAMRALCAPGCTFEDRRRLALLSGDVELLIASARERVAMGARVQRRPIGTAGERVAIEALLWSGGPSDGRFEIEYLGVIEVDASGRCKSFVLFDVDDLDAARREAWARWAAIDPEGAAVAAPMVELVSAFNAHDRGRWRAQLADELVVEDYRRTGMGRIEGADAYADSLVALWALAPDTAVEAGLVWPALDRHGAITLVRRTGRIPDGGDFESEYLNLYTVSAGRITHAELYEVEDLDRALARFEALRPPSPSELRRPSPDSLRIPPNAAFRAWNRWYELVEAGNWDALAAMYAASYRIEERRRFVQQTSDLAGLMITARFIREQGARPVRTLLATAGDRLALQRNVWTVGQGNARSEIETLTVTEVDSEGKFARTIDFDPGDRASAQTELSERYIAGGADGASRAMLEVPRAWNDHDLERLRAVLPDDFYLDDRRRTGVGRIDGAEPYLASLVALWDLSADIRLDILYTAATAPQGRLYVTRWSGTNGEGGDFEAIYVCVGLIRGGQLAGLEIFEIDDFTAARARFEALAR